MSSPNAGRILCLDWGEKRIGVALSDEERVFAFPHSTIENRGTTETLAELQQLCRKEEVELVLVGLPLTSRGEFGRQALVVANFMDTLKGQLGVPIEYVDERLSTREARRREGAKTKDRSSGVLDQRAAQVVLQSYLDARQTTH